MANFRSRSRDNERQREERQREEDQRDNRGHRDRGRRFERIPERRTSRESRERQERKLLEERVESRREEQARENRTWSNNYQRRFLPRTYIDKDRDHRGKKQSESKPEQVEENKMEKIEKSRKKKSRKEDTDSSSSSSSGSGEDESEEEEEKADMDLAKEILKLAKGKLKEKTRHKRAIRKAKKKNRKSIARTNDSVTGYHSDELYNQKTTAVQAIKEDKKISTSPPVKEVQKKPKVVRKVSGGKEKQVNEKPTAVIPPQAIPPPDTPTPEVIEVEENQSQEQIMEDTEDVPLILGEITRRIQRYITGDPEEEFQPMYSPIEPSYSPTTPEYFPSSSPPYPPLETTIPITESEAVTIQVEERELPTTIPITESEAVTIQVEEREPPTTITNPGSEAIPIQIEESVIGSRALSPSSRALSPEKEKGSVVVMNYENEEATQTEGSEAIQTEAPQGIHEAVQTEGPKGINAAIQTERYPTVKSPSMVSTWTNTPLPVYPAPFVAVTSCCYTNDIFPFEEMQDLKIYEIEAMVRKQRHDLQIKSTYIKNLEDSVQKLCETIATNLPDSPAFLFQELMPHFQSLYLPPPPVQHNTYYEDHNEMESFNNHDEFIHNTDSPTEVDQEDTFHVEDEPNIEEGSDVESQTLGNDKDLDVD